MPKVYTGSLRSLASKVRPSILTGAITESADYIDELEEELRVHKKVVEELREENEKQFRKYQILLDNWVNRES